MKIYGKFKSHTLEQKYNWNHKQTYLIESIMHYGVQNIDQKNRERNDRDGLLIKKLLEYLDLKKRKKNRFM